MSTDQTHGRTVLRLASVGGASFAGLLLLCALALAMAITGASFGCTGSSASAAAPSANTGPTRAARKQIPPPRLRLYLAAGARERIDWTFLASIGAQECNHQTCAGDNGSGCAGPMQIAIRKGSPCSPGGEPTEWDRFKTDGDHDGHFDVNDPADAIFTAARILLDKGAPRTGGTYTQYRQAACRYYGACADGVAAYADEVMARAVLYGFHGAGSPAPSDAGQATPVADPSTTSGCHAATPIGGGVLGERIVQIARSQLGTGEQPNGSNCTRYGPCEEWCALFVAWVWQHAGSALPSPTSRWAYTGSLYTYARTYGHHVLPPTAKPNPGDAVLYGSGPAIGHSAHVGIVIKVLADGRIVTIDGNSTANNVALVGPFKPVDAVRFGLPAPIYGYAQPPAARTAAGTHA